MSNSDQCHILQLNDDCFYEIYKFLPPIDWCSLRETCIRLRTVFDYWFNRQSERFDLDPTIVYGNDDLSLSLNDSKRLIRNFGHFTTTLSMKQRFFIDEENPKTLLLLIDQCCSALRTLRLFEMDFGPTTVAQCNALFSNFHGFQLELWYNIDIFGMVCGT